MSIDGNKIIHAVTEGSKIQDSKGIIPLFGVYLSLFPVIYYNRVSFELEKKLQGKQKREAECLLIRASQECGYSMFQGIRSSREWDDLVKPMIECNEDQLRGFTAVASALGWGHLVVQSITPDQELVVHVQDSYEATGYLQDYGLAEFGKCYMLRGVAAALMDLLYGAEYPDGCFTFWAIEPRCRAQGDKYCEFIARKQSN